MKPYKTNPKSVLAGRDWRGKFDLETCHTLFR